jgi:REP element-mobilizing transposase RayT
MKGWHNRGYLPHFDGGEILQFITVHLGDALPQKVVERWKLELEHEKDEEKSRQMFIKREKYLDQGYGECDLGKTEIAEIVKESLLHFDSVRYKLIAWVIMPNHTHFLIKPINDVSVSVIMQRFKSFTAHEANRILQKNGKFWQVDYFDRFIRDYEHFEKTVNYIENNPVKAGLCEKKSEWKYSSAYGRNADD